MSDKEFDPSTVRPAIGDHTGQPSEHTIARARHQFELDRQMEEHRRATEERKAAQLEAHERQQAASQIAAADRWLESGGGSNWRGMQRPRGRYADARIAEHEKAKQTADSA